MAGAVRFALRHSKLVIGGWIAVIAVCAGFGLASGNAFTPPNLVAADTGTGQWLELADESDFGLSTSIMLTGPKPALREQGMALTAKLRQIQDVRVLSPFDKPAKGVGKQPRTPFTEQRGNSALFLVDLVMAPGEDPADAVPVIRRAIDATVRPPVTSRVTGAPAVAKGLSDESYAATHRSERIAAPILMLVLLLIFRSPVAAAVPGIMGLGTVLAGKGIVQTLATMTSLDQMALNLASMMGLALGVDYSLLMVSRYREHRRANPGAVHENIERATRATGRTIAAAAMLVLAVMTTAMLLSIGPIFTAAALGVGVATVFGALTAIFVAPALLLVLDPWLERWRVPSLWKGRESRFARRQPIAVPIVALVALLALAAPSLGIEPGAPDVKLLPEESQARVDYEQIAEVVGPGFGAVFDIAIRSRDDTPLTKPRTLAALTRLQHRIGADPGVATIIGPAAIAGLTKGMNGLRQNLADQRRGLARLDRGLGEAADGSRRVGDGARQLHDATGAAQKGAVRLANGLQAATAGSDDLVGGIDATSGGGERLASGSRQASAGAGRLSSALEQASASSGAASNNARVLSSDLQTGSDQLAALDQPVATAEQRLDAAWKALQAMTSGRTDPQYQATLDAVTAAAVAVTGTDPGTGEQLDAAYAGIGAGIDDAAGQLSLGLYLSGQMQAQGEQTQRSVRQLASGAARLDEGIAELTAGSAKLSDGLEQLALSGRQLPGGLDRLSRGAGLLEDGLGKIDAGSGRLAAGIGGSDGQGQLTSGLDRMQAALERQRRGSQSASLTQNSPGLFSAGGLPLAAVNGATRPNRDRARLVLDLTNGGRAARILAVPAYATSDGRIAGLHDRITEISQAADGEKLEVAVGGPAAGLQDFKDKIAPRMPLIVGAFALISLIMLLVVVRAVPLAAICVALNLLTVGVAFGTMQLTFGSTDPLLGGPGHVDLIVLFGSLAIVFALSIDYQVFLLARIREEYDESHDHERAVTAAIGSTAGVITGAAAVMVAVFAAFCTSSHIGIRELGIGLAVAVFLDATVVRLILLPAAMRLVGDRVWWFPAWLDRRLPSFSL